MPQWHSTATVERLDSTNELPQPWPGTYDTCPFLLTCVLNSHHHHHDQPVTSLRPTSLISSPPIVVKLYSRVNLSLQAYPSLHCFPTMPNKSSVKAPVTIRRKQEQFKTMKVGCRPRWTDAQQDAIDSYLPSWHKFSLEENGDLDGRDLKLLNWKKKVVDDLLSSDKFSVLPEEVSFIVI